MEVWNQVTGSLKKYDSIRGLNAIFSIFPWLMNPPYPRWPSSHGPRMDAGVVSSSSSQSRLRPFKLGLGLQDYTTPSTSPRFLASRWKISLGWKLWSCSLELRGKPYSLGRAVMASRRATGGESLSPWDDKPYELLPTGRRAYLDEQDVVSFLDPPKELIPIDPASYNPAAYLW